MNTLAPEDLRYRRTEVYWHVLAARLAFVVVFQNFVSLSVMAIKVLIPNVSTELKERIRREAYLTNEIIIRTELLRATGKLDDVGRELKSSGGGGPGGDVDDDDCQKLLPGEQDEDVENGLRKRCDTSTSDEDAQIRRRGRLARHATGDITDGDIVV